MNDRWLTLHGLTITWPSFDLAGRATRSNGRSLLRSWRDSLELEFEAHTGAVTKSGDIRVVIRHHETGVCVCVRVCVCVCHGVLRYLRVYAFTARWSVVNSQTFEVALFIAVFCVCQ